MHWRPDPAEVWKAIEQYLRIAYAKGAPAAVRARLEALRAVPACDFYASTILEHDSSPEPHRYNLRLGNQFYPHMKLAIERRPDGTGHLFRADTHDRHCCPDPSSREYGAFCQLMEMNQKLSQQIESAWEQEHLPTFKSYLREDLARRRAQASSGA